MSRGDAIRSKIKTVELALKEAGPENALNAIVDVLKEIANADFPVTAPAAATSLKSSAHAAGDMVKAPTRK
jgi:hypothetical protein